MSIQPVSSVSPQVQSAAAPTPPPAVASSAVVQTVGVTPGSNPARTSTGASQATAPQTPPPSQNVNHNQAAQQSVEPSRADLQEALSEVREAVTSVASNLQFSIDDDTGRTVIRIIDSSTDEVIRQIPSEELIAMAKALDKLQGLLIRQEV